MTRVAINGFGRIGRMVFRQAIKESAFEIVAINASYPSETLAHLIKYDTVHGKFDGTVEAFEDHLLVDGKMIRLLNNRDPKELPWTDLGVEVVIEATGKFNARDKADLHLEAGAKKVILTAPGKEEDKTVVMGVNEHELDIQQHHIISNASCTTNALKLSEEFLFLLPSPYPEV